MLSQVLEARAINPGLLCVNVVSGLQFESLQICRRCCLRMQLVRHWILFRMTTTRLPCFFLFVPLGWFWLGTSEWKIVFTRRNLSSPYCYWAITRSRSEVNGTRFILCEFGIMGEIYSITFGFLLSQHLLEHSLQCIFLSHNRL